MSQLLEPRPSTLAYDKCGNLQFVVAVHRTGATYRVTCVAQDSGREHTCTWGRDGVCYENAPGWEDVEALQSCELDEDDLDSVFPWYRYREN